MGVTKLPWVKMGGFFFKCPKPRQTGVYDVLLIKIIKVEGSI